MEMETLGDVALDIIDVYIDDLRNCVKDPNSLGMLPSKLFPLRSKFQAIYSIGESTDFIGIFMSKVE
jgi:hypothetical protein